MLEAVDFVNDLIHIGVDLGETALVQQDNSIQRAAAANEVRVRLLHALRGSELHSIILKPIRLPK